MDLQFENRFWLQILGDHVRFIEMSLAVKEIEMLKRSLILKEDLDELLMEARARNVTVSNILPVVEALKEFKLDILNQQISGQIEISLPPTFLNHSLNELEKYEKILLDPEAKPHILEDHYLWQADAAGHALTIIQKLDPTEKKIMKAMKKVKKAFLFGFEAATEYIGYLRTGNIEFPAIDKLNQETLVELLIFTKMLETIRDERIDLKVLGGLNPLLLYHMLAEEAYFIMKLMEETGQKFPLSIQPDADHR